MLEHETDVAFPSGFGSWICVRETDFTGVGTFQTGDHPQQRAFCPIRGAQQSHQRTLRPAEKTRRPAALKGPGIACSNPARQCSHATSRTENPPILVKISLGDSGDPRGSVDFRDGKGRGDAQGKVVPTGQSLVAWRSIAPRPRPPAAGLETGQPPPRGRHDLAGYDEGRGPAARPPVRRDWPAAKTRLRQRASSRPAAWARPWDGCSRTSAPVKARLQLGRFWEKPIKTNRTPSRKGPTATRGLGRLPIEEDFRTSGFSVEPRSPDPQRRRVVRPPATVRKTELHAGAHE